MKENKLSQLLNEIDEACDSITDPEKGYSPLRIEKHQLTIKRLTDDIRQQLKSLLQPIPEEMIDKYLNDQEYEPGHEEERAEDRVTILDFLKWLNDTMREEGRKP